MPLPFGSNDDVPLRKRVCVFTLRYGPMNGRTEVADIRQGARCKLIARFIQPNEREFQSSERNSNQSGNKKLPENRFLHTGARSWIVDVRICVP